MADYITKKEKPKYITLKSRREKQMSPEELRSRTTAKELKELADMTEKEKPKKQYITRKSAKPIGSGVEDTSGKTLWITKKKPAYITKKKYAGGGRATHGYGRAYMKGGRAK